MRIFYITDARMPTEKAHGYQIVKMCEAFRAQGAEVHLVVPRRKNAIGADLFAYYGIPPSFSVHYLPAPDMVSWFLFRCFPASLVPYAARMAWFLPAARAFVRAHLSPADTVYTRSWEIALSLSGRKNVFFEVHEIGRAHRLVPWLYGRLTGIVAITTCLRDIISRRIRGSGAILVAPDAVDLRLFASVPTAAEARHRLGLPQEGIVIGYVGMLTVHGGTEKGVDILIQAAASLRARGLSPFLVVAGGPASAASRCRSLAASLGLGDHSIFPGLVPRADVPVWMQACDILVIPWPWTVFSAYYTSPLKLFEYMASGKPLVVSDLPALREVADERFARFAVPGDHASLADACAALMGDPVLRARLGAASRRLASSYTWDRRAAAILAFMQARCAMNITV